MKKLFLFSVAIMVNMLICAQGNWSLQNPYPLAGNFTDIQATSDQIAVLVSDDGLIVQTTDAGKHWDTLFYDNDPIFNFRKIAFPDQDHGWAMSDVLMKTNDGGNNWIWAPTILNNGEYNDIFFLDQNIGFVAGKLGNKATVLMTRDGGQLWSYILSDSSMWAAFSVEFVNDSTGFVGGYSKALKTTDGGISWTDMQIPIYGFSVKFIHFFDEYNGYIGCEDGRILKTFDGGNSWEICADHGIYLHSMYFTDMSVGWVSGTVSEQGILKTTFDGGDSWTTCMLDNNNCFYGIDFFGNDYGWLVGNLGAIHNSIDGGIFWDKKSGTITSASLEAIHFINQHTGWISCYDPNILLKTNDGGVSWAEIYDFGENHMRELVFTDEDNGWGYSGAKLFKTMDGGYSWDSIFSVAHWGIKSMHAFDANKIFVTDDTCVYRSMDGGQAWQIVSICDTSCYYSEITFRENTGWITASKGSWWTYESNIYRSDDGGMNWYLLNISDDYSRLYFINQDTGFAVAFHSSWGGWMSTHIDKTTDGGVNWDTKFSTGGEYWCPSFHSIEFRDENNGWALANNWGLKTSDGGETWVHPEDPPNHGHDIIFTDASSGWWINDFYLWKYEDGTIVSIHDGDNIKSGNTLLVYPNPCSGALHLRYSIPVLSGVEGRETRNLKLEMYSADGVMVKLLMDGMQQPGESVLEFDVSDLPDGMYFIRLQAGTQMETAKIILQK